MDQSHRDLSALFVAGARLCSTLELDSLVELIIATGLQLAHADNSSLLLVDEGQGDLVVAGSSHLNPQVISATRISMGQGLVGWVARNREARLQVGPANPEQFGQTFARPSQISSCIAAPLLQPPNLVPRLGPETRRGAPGQYRDRQPAY